MKPQFYLFISFVICGICCFSCRDTIEFETPDSIKDAVSNVDNPKDEVYGFFFATESNFKRIYVSPEFAGNPTRVCPPVGPNVLCINCLCQENSSIEKPEWWTE